MICMERRKPVTKNNFVVSRNLPLYHIASPMPDGPKVCHYYGEHLSVIGGGYLSRWAGPNIVVC